MVKLIGAIIRVIFVVAIENMTEELYEDIPLAQIRPRFRLTTTEKAAAIADKLRTGLRSENATCMGEAHSSYALLRIPNKDVHYWSPQLHVTFEETEEGTIVRGLYGPKPTVWTMFVFFYAIVGFAVLILSIVGYSHYKINGSIGLLWLIPVLVLLFFTLYAVAYLGKKKGYAHSEVLHRFFTRATGLNY